MQPNPLIDERLKVDDFRLRHGDPVVIKDGTVRLFETGAFTIFDEFSGRAVFHEPSKDDGSRLKVQRDYYHHSLPPLESEFNTLKTYRATQGLRDRLVELQNLILAYRGKIEEIDKQLKQTCDVRIQQEQITRVRAVDAAMALHQQRLQNEIDQINI